ncbi:chemotaxis protein CheB [Dyella tabacisoli]|uniref:protein-glutamate methylesterase n=1 Tax=Dyella tabacisoli TaxID=2282381 RepID=A0A369USW6_9GAMM|nr:chemotaxis protein CheB [Dyella tabacisoli]RDD82710.1 chemotaxis protein CheB [Dyella tabacisoli]
MSDGVSSQQATTVALLFDDVELGGHLREALRERGAHIVHEGALSALSRDMLRSVEVVVVNLDDDAADELNHLYDLIDGDHPRVVFNDAQATRSLKGWDRARWARHLAAKVLKQGGDLDPPRPHDAPGFVSPSSVPVAEPAQAPLMPSGAVQVAAVAELFVAEPAANEPAPAEPVAHVHVADEPLSVHAAPEVQHSTDESESLAAELEALLAADQQHAGEGHEDDFGSGLNYNAGDDQLLHDGHFGVTHAAEPEDIKPGSMEAAHADVARAAPAATVAARPAFQLDHLSLAPLDDVFPIAATSIPMAKHESVHGLIDLDMTDIDITDIEMEQTASWSLLDDDAPLSDYAPSKPAPGKPHATEFGIEKLSAADYLAPEGGDADGMDIKPGLSLELVSLEDAIAPQHYDHEMVLNVLDAALGRVLVMGAAVDSVDSVRTFLAALPANLRLTILHTQHLGGQTPEALTAKLTPHSSLPIRVASKGQRAKVGEVLVVPANQQIRLLRDGRIESQTIEPSSAQAPSIDASFTMAANVFGRDAIAIVFAGNANDAVAGAQAIHDRGGQVWVESTPDEHFADMVHGVQAERLVHFSGTPHELAARLIDLESRR